MADGVEHQRDVPAGEPREERGRARRRDEHLAQHQPQHEELLVRERREARVEPRHLPLEGRVRRERRGDVVEQAGVRVLDDGGEELVLRGE